MLARSVFLQLGPGRTKSFEVTALLLATRAMLPLLALLAAAALL